MRAGSMAIQTAAAAAWIVAAAAAGQEPDAAGPQRLAGRVAWLGDALARRGVRVVEEAAQRSLVLETPDGRLAPIVEDVRGRSFRADPRLRDRQVELLVRRVPQSPFVQVIRVYAWNEKGEKCELDYWCDVCAIAMYELKPCDCCQGPIQLRLRPVQK